MIIRCIDVETTGLDPAKGARVCEIGWTDIIYSNGFVVQRPKSILVNPGCSIPPEASAINHIIDDDVKFAPDINEALAVATQGQDLTFCAHKADFERQFIKTSADWICTLKVASHLWQDAPAYNLQTLRYWLKLDVDKEVAAPAHRAHPDSYVCAYLLLRMLVGLTIDKAINISSKPVLMSKFSFGKHRNEPVSSLPSDYLQWILKSSDLGEDVKYTASHELKKRAA